MDIRIGDVFQGEIIDFTHEGSGVLKIENYIIFVKEALIGDIVKVRVTKTKKKFSEGEIVEIIKASKDRVKLGFHVEESRGSVPLIYYDYKKQVEWKREKIKSDLSKIGGLEGIDIRETLGMENPFGYRNHIQMAVGEEDGKIVIGFYELNSNKIVDMQKSILQPEIGNKIVKIIRSWMEKHKIKPYDKKTKKGVLRYIGIRLNKDNQAMVILVTGNSLLPNKEGLIQELSKENVVSIYQNINKSNTSITYGQDYKKIYGDEKLLDYIGEYKFFLSPNSFIQTNRIQAEKLYKKALEYLDPDKGDIVYDLYSGIGSISLYIANKVNKVYGIEIVKEATEDAIENARLNNIKNVEFITGKVEEIFPTLVEKGIKGNKLVIDPPRKGCDQKVLEEIIKINPESLVYVSCNPSTMARDVKYLVENGYKLEEVQPVDMFPHTAGVECVCRLERL